MNVLFSIIVPVYNAELYIKKCVESIMLQDEQDWELFLVDDGSTDDSLHICHAYAEKDSRVRVFHQPNAGHTAARNHGLKNARGQYVLFVDSDDWIEKDTLATLRQIVSSYHPQIILFANTEWHECTGTARCISHGIADGLYTDDGLAALLRDRLMMNQWGLFFPRSLWGKAFSRELIQTHQLRIPPNIRIAEDMCAVVSAVNCADSLYVMSEPLYWYRIRESSICHQADATAFSRHMSCIEYLYQEAGLPLDDEEYGKQFQRLVVNQMYSASLQATGAFPAEWRNVRRDFRQMKCSELCRHALETADFSDTKMRIKHFLLRHDMLFSIYLLRKLRNGRLWKK